MIYLLSPVPPKRTGPADYLREVLSELNNNHPGSAGAFTIVDMDPGPQASSFFPSDIEVIDYRGLNLTSCDTAVYFLASNEHHFFVFEALARHRVGRCICVIHDLTSGFIHKYLAYSDYNTLSKTDFVMSASFEFGERAEWVTDKIEHLSRTASFFFMAQGTALRKAECVIVHSHYARIRLLLETMPNMQLPPILVGHHPEMVTQSPSLSISDRRSRRQSTSASDRRFTVATFGFLNEIKRVPSIILAFGAFVNRLCEAERAQCRLVLGGQVDDAIGPALHGAREDSRIDDLVEMTGFLNEDDLDRRISECDLIFCLRFPSCGETSGILARVRAAGVPVAVSDFAAFAEEPASFHISPLVETEHEELVDVLQRTFDSWLKHEQEPPYSNLVTRNEEALRVSDHLNNLLY